MALGNGGINSVAVLKGKRVSLASIGAVFFGYLLSPVDSSDELGFGTQLKRLSVSLSYIGRTVETPAAVWPSQPCHRSLYSNQFRVALQLALEDPYQAVTFLSFSCSGASIASGVLGLYDGIERIRFRPRRFQISDVAVAQCGGGAVETRNYASTFTASGTIPALNNLSLDRCPPSRAR